VVPYPPPLPVPPVAPPPGWYRDPTGHRPYRWWDGADWSAYAAGTDVEWDPIAAPAAAERQPGLPCIGVALFAFGLAVGLSLLSIVVLRALGRPGGLALELAVSEVCLWIPLVGAVLFVSRRRGTGSVVADYGLRFRWADLGFGLAGSVAARSVAGIVILPVVLFHPVFPHVHSELARLTGSPADWALLVGVTCVGAPFVEELFFRGLLQTRLVALRGPVVGILVTSVLFGAAHLLSWVGPASFVYALSVAGGGVVLGTIRHLTGRLGTSITAHAFFNLQAMLALAVVVHWAHQI
jgi:membrane protease YdiL (CAAX protease family)